MDVYGSKGILRVMYKELSSLITNAILIFVSGTCPTFVIERVFRARVTAGTLVKFRKFQRLCGLCGGIPLALNSNHMVSPDYLRSDWAIKTAHAEDLRYF
jgi:hypothetical protein